MTEHGTNDPGGLEVESSTAGASGGGDHGNGHPETFTCPDCGGFRFILIFGGTLPQAKVKCDQCGSCWFVGRTS